jgi:DNA-binding response OmpR family regulator
MAHPNRERKRILLVEDNEDTWDMVAYSLKAYALFFARNFDDGLRLAQQWDFDLYIFDNWLPGRSGVELCHAIREFDPDTPILFYSAAAYARDKREAIRAGAQDYLVKPVTPDDLRQTVAQLISTRPKLNHSDNLEALRNRPSSTHKKMSSKR